MLKKVKIEGKNVTIRADGQKDRRKPGQQGGGLEQSCNSRRDGTWEPSSHKRGEEKRITGSITV